MEFDYFEFGGALLADLYAMLDPRLASLTAAIDPACPEEFPRFDTIEHISGVAAVAAQHYITVTCQWWKVDRDIGLALGPKVGNVFHRCDYPTLKSIISDLKEWTALVIEQAEIDAAQSAPRD